MNLKRLTSQRWFWGFLIFMMVMIYISLQGIALDKLTKKVELQKQVDDLRARYISISEKLLNMSLEPVVEEEIRRRGLELLKDNQVPKVIVVPKNSEEK